MASRKLPPQLVKLISGQDATEATGQVLMTDLTWRASLKDCSPLEIGVLDSKQGSVRRSRKGVTRIMPNGYSRYQRQWWDVTVAAYPAPKVVK